MCNYSRIHSDRLVHVDTGMRRLLNTSISQRERSFEFADWRRCEGPRKQRASESRSLEGHRCRESTRKSRERGMARDDRLRKSSAKKGSTERHLDCCLAFCGLQKRQSKGNARTRTIAVSTSHRDDETPGRSRGYLPVVSIYGGDMLHNSNRPGLGCLGGKNSRNPSLVEK